jgi:hypothetical protein
MTTLATVFFLIALLGLFFGVLGYSVGVLVGERRARRGF